MEKFYCFSFVFPHMSWRLLLLVNQKGHKNDNKLNVDYSILYAILMFIFLSSQANSSHNTFSYWFMKALV